MKKKIYNYDKCFKILFRREGLDQDNIFFLDYETYEEIPIASRWKYLKFLDGLSTDEKNILLISQALKRVDSIFEAYNVKDRFICVNLLGWEDIEEAGFIIPNFFISKKIFLKFYKTNSIHEELVKKYISKINNDKYVVRSEVNSGNPDDYIERVYIIRKELLPLVS